MIEIFKLYKNTYYTDFNGNIHHKNTWEVSNLGRVKKNGNIVNLKEHKQRYYRVCGEYLHRIVAKLFIGDISEGYQIDHIDTNRFNNRVDNLRIVTCKENSNNSLTIKHKKERIYKKHSDNTKQKMSELAKKRWQNKEYINKQINAHIGRKKVYNKDDKTFKYIYS